MASTSSSTEDSRGAALVVEDLVRQNEQGRSGASIPHRLKEVAKGEGEDDSELLNKIKDGLEYVKKMQQLKSPWR